MYAGLLVPLVILGLSILDLLFLAYASTVVAIMLVSVLLFAGFPRLPAETAAGERPLVSIILPVRNQESSVETCVSSLLSSDYPEKELIVVDGGSTDSTKAILERYGGRLTLLEEPPLPVGWVGKNWACHQGFLASRGEILLFTDGDTLHRPGLLSRAVSYLRSEEIDLLTLHSRLRVGTFWEKVIQPLMIFLIGFTYRGNWVNRPDKRRWAVGNGQFLMFRREVYEALGGHASVRDRVDEDYRLARLTKERGYSLRMVDGRDALDVRMYTSLQEIWYGWAKNSFPGLDFSLYKIVRSAVGLFLLLVLPFIGLVWGLVETALGRLTLIVPLALIPSGLIWSRLAIAHWMLGGRPAYAALTPLGALIIVGILLDSARRYLRSGGVPWKGRTYGISGR